MEVLRNKKYLSIFGFAVFIFMLVFFCKQRTIALDCDSSLLTSEEQRECDKLKDKAKTYNSLIKIKEKQADSIASQLQLINRNQEKTSQELETTSEKLTETRSQLENLVNRIKENEKQINFQKKILRGLMQSYYENNQEGMLDLVILENKLSDLLRRPESLKQFGTKINEVLANIQKTKKELENQQGQLEEKEGESEKLKEELERKNLSLQENEEQKSKYLAQTQAEKEKYEKLLDEIDNEIYELESGKNDNIDFSKIPPSKGDYFYYPVSKVNITQGYGMTSYAKQGAYGGKPHNGIDFGTNGKYVTVYSAKSGKVLATGNNGRYAYGKWIALDHGDGLLTLYGHLSSISASKGEKVESRKKIGVSGNTGYSTGPHLHFSVFVKDSFEIKESKYVKGLMIPVGASINPMRYL